MDDGVAPQVGMNSDCHQKDGTGVLHYLRCRKNVRGGLSNAVDRFRDVKIFLCLACFPSTWKRGCTALRARESFVGTEREIHVVYSAQYSVDVLIRSGPLLTVSSSCSFVKRNSAAFLCVTYVHV